MVLVEVVKLVVNIDRRFHMLLHLGEGQKLLKKGAKLEPVEEQ